MDSASFSKWLRTCKTKNQQSQIWRTYQGRQICFGDELAAVLLGVREMLASEFRKGNWVNNLASRIMVSYPVGNAKSVKDFSISLSEKRTSVANLDLKDGIKRSLEGLVALLDLVNAEFPFEGKEMLDKFKCCVRDMTSKCDLDGMLKVACYVLAHPIFYSAEDYSKFIRVAYDIWDRARLPLYKNDFLRKFNDWDVNDIVAEERGRTLDAVLKRNIDSYLYESRHGLVTSGSKLPSYMRNCLEHPEFKYEGEWEVLLNLLYCLAKKGKIIPALYKYLVETFGLDDTKCVDRFGLTMPKLLSNGPLGFKFRIKIRV